MRQLTDEEMKVFKYLNRLRKSGKTNMFGARPYVMRQFSMEETEAKRILLLWMKNFDEKGEYDRLLIP